MLIDLTKLVLLLIGYMLHGEPERWDYAWGVRLSVQGGYAESVTLEIAYDPVPMFRADLKDAKISGYAVGAYVVAGREYEGDMLEIIYRHELNHIWQTRTHGMLVPVTYAFMPSLWEPKPYEFGNFEGMPAPRALNWSLFKLWIPLR